MVPYLTYAILTKQGTHSRDVYLYIWYRNKRLIKTFKWSGLMNIKYVDCEVNEEERVYCN